jgi:hypothetical protein
MAKRNSKKSQGASSVSPSSNKKNVDMGVEEAENGYVVRVSSNGEGGEYKCKKYVAPDYASAIRIATESMAGISSKSKGNKKKGGKRKAISTKKV